MENDRGRRHRILLSVGDPAGIGPDLILNAAQNRFTAEIIAVGSPECLLQRAGLLDLPVTLETFQAGQPRRSHRPGILPIVPVQPSVIAIAGKTDPRNANHVLESIRTAATLCLDGVGDALVTLPVNKAMINAGGFPFSGHTEFIAGLCGGCHPVMMLQNKALRVILATTHIPLRQVAGSITRDLLRKVIETADTDLRLRMGVANPRLLVCGLNPHAGEGGYLGAEEQEVIGPELESLRTRGFNVRGPIPADTAFIQPNLATADAVVVMYHDQGLPVLKSLGFGESVNITLGLPIIRTSVDHGTAYELAGAGKASADSLLAAIECAIEMTERSKPDRV
ncbi:MAG TPA: 4-hydroxythreonine-4-phosphate dehydrogenase PdxA [Gammaproteobacteria bacterium]|nr:4-hydroxythreonine-4-phosphate dehydrogenase PdxA [Gammaproteobacteria bacterium]